jgi:hypothetical protein
MKDINDLAVEEQIKLINSEKFYHCLFEKKPNDEINGYKVGISYISLHSFDDGTSHSWIPYIYDPFFFIFNIKNPSEELQIEFVRNLKNSHYNRFVYDYIKSEKALELYKKLKKVHSIIK